MKSTREIQKKYDRIARFYDVLEKPMEKMALGKWKDSLFADMTGKILEVGVGTGKNIEYYHKDIDVTAIDFSSKMLSKARARADQLGKKVDLKLMDAQNMEFEDDSFDYIVATCVFCSVPDPVEGLKEVRRVLKPQGKIVLIEHVRSEGRIMGTLMDIFNPLVVNMYGANINRRTEENIKMAGFSKMNVTSLWKDIVKKIELQQ